MATRRNTKPKQHAPAGTTRQVKSSDGTQTRTTPRVLIISALGLLRISGSYGVWLELYLRVSLSGRRERAADNFEVWLKLGATQLQQQKLDAAERSARKAIERKAEDSAAWLVLNQILVLRKDPSAAREAFQHWQDLKNKAERPSSDHSFETKHALAMANFFASTFRSLAVFYQDRENNRVAQEMFARAVQVAPQDIAALASWASFLRHVGNFQKAIDVNRQLLELQPKEAAHYQNLANLFMELNHPRKGRSSLAASLPTPANQRELAVIAGSITPVFKQATRSRKSRACGIPASRHRCRKGDLESGGKGSKLSVHALE